MDDPTPISFDTDGTLYKRAVRLPNGDWAPTTCCNCDGPGGFDCLDYDPDTQIICLRLEFSGIQPNPWRLGVDACNDDCSFTVVNDLGVLLTREVRNLAGVNRAFTYSQSTPNIYPANIATLVVESNSDCEDYTYNNDGVNPDVQGSDVVRVLASAGCNAGNRLRLTSVDMDTNQQGGIGSIFRWVGGITIQVGQAVTVPNQLQCETQTTGPFAGRTWGPVALGGTCTVTATAVPRSNLGQCSVDDPNYLAVKCDGTEQIAVDIADSTGVFLNVRRQGEDLFRMTSEQSTLAAEPVEFVNELCLGPVDPPEYPIAVQCDGSAFITYDPGTNPQTGQTLLWEGIRYAPIGATSRQEPVPATWSSEPCPPDDTGIYQINLCGSSQAANQTFSINPDTGNLQSQTVGYRPGTGLQPGDGHVFILVPNGSGCLTQVAATPTAVPLDTEPDVVVTSRLGSCRGIPSVVVDQRPQCQSTDSGGGFQDDAPNIQAPAEDADISAFQLGNLVEQALKTISLNKLETCPACQRRKEVLNRYGDRVGKAILRVLNW